MADMSRIELLDGTIVNIKDAVARANLENKVSTSQGVANAGKYLSVDNNGNVTLVDLPVYDGSVS